MAERYKTVFLDWMGTLSQTEFFDHLEDSTHPHAYLHNQLKHALDVDLWPTIAKPWMKGEFKTEDIAKAIANHTGIPFETVLEEMVEGSKRMQIDEEVLSLVAQIRAQGVHVVIATGNVDAFDRWTIPSLDLADKFDAILNSSTLKAMKKDKDIDGSSLFFRDYLVANGILPEECVIIDDSPDKDDVIARFGIAYIQLRNGNSLKDELEKIMQTISDKENL